MESNTARKLSASELIKSFNEQGVNLDLLKVFLITGTTDISKAVEMIAKWAKAPGSDVQKAMFNADLNDLQYIMHRRVELTKIFYEIGQPAAQETTEPEATTFLMLPKLDDVLARVQKALTDGKGSTESIKDAYSTLKTSVGCGKATDINGKPITWDNNKINEFLEANEPKTEPVAGGETKDNEIGFDTIANYITDLANFGKSEEEIKASLKIMILNNAITTKGGGKTLMTGEQVFEDYYTRALHAMVACAMKQKAKADSSADVVVAATEQIEKEVKPFLEALDKNAKESSIAGATNKVNAIYKNLGIKKSLQDVLSEVEKLAEKWAPNLYKKRKEATKSTKPLDAKTTDQAVQVEPVIDIYDDSHNIKESNKGLWTEVENYTLLDEIYNKSVVLVKEDKWKDALCMCILLISSKKINEVTDSKEPLSWDNKQIKNWFHKIVIEPLSQSAAEVKPETQTIGPVPQQGFSNVEEPANKVTVPIVEEKVTEKIVKTLKQSEPWKAKYQFKTIEVPVEHYTTKTMSFQVVDATIEQEPTVLVTEVNFTKLLDSQRDLIVANGNKVKDVRKNLKQELEKYYEISHGECKSITGAIAKEAGLLRKEIKKTQQSAKSADTGSGAPAAVVIPTEVQYENAPKEDDDDTLYFSTLVVGENVFEKKNGKKMPIEDGEWELTSHEVDYIIETKDGIIKNVERVKADIDTSPAAKEVENPQVKDNKVVLPPEEKKPNDQPIITPTEKSVTDAPTNSNNQGESTEATSEKESAASASTGKPSARDYTGFDEIVKSSKKLEFDKAIYAKVSSYADRKEGIKAVYEIIDSLKGDNHYKRAFARNYKNTKPVDLLAMINKVVETGDELVKQS